jgi:transaldolase
MGIDQRDRRRAVFIDRDGVINRAVMRGGLPYAPATVADLEVLPGVAEALERLRAAGFRLIVVTNQPDIARGLQPRDVVEAMHAQLLDTLPLDAIRMCPHDDQDRCTCRKPLPGMLVEEAHRDRVDLAASFMVGDRWRDVEAGRQAGCVTLFVDHGYSEARPDADAVVGSLAEAADWILARGSDPAERLLQGTRMKPLEQLSVKIFADGADLAGMVEMYRRPYIKGFTTNPTLMRKAGVRDYGEFARAALAAIPDRPISFEVLSDDFAEMERQAHEIAAWGERVYVKIPITNSRGTSCCPLARRLSHSGIKVNVTALLSLDQVKAATDALACGAPASVSVFAGRVADTGRDPVPLMAEALDVLRAAPNTELIWASPRELLNLFQADQIGCHIITVTHDILNKLPLIGRSLEDFSLDTVRMFVEDAGAAGFSL